MSYRIRYRILGPLEVDPLVDHPALRRTKPRALLALPLLCANEVVPESDVHLARSRVPANSPPPDTASIQSYLSRLEKEFKDDVSQLREALGKDVLVTQPGWYMLRIHPDELDLAVFERLVAKARGAFTATRADRLHSALALWRGPALTEFEFLGWPRRKLDELESLRRDALRERIDADLELGRHSELVDELEALYAKRGAFGLGFLEQLIIALHGAGRNADALAAYREGCRALRDEIGEEPSHELHELARAIREHDAM